MKEQYVYQNESGGIPGLPHEIDKDIGDAWIDEYEEAKDRDPEKYLEGMPGCVLLAALKNKSYKLIGGKDEKPPKKDKE